MESLLSLAFDNLASFDGGKIKKGLKQVEGLLAQICLSGPSSPRKQDRERGREQAPRKVLADLSADPAFREFFKLQEGFEWNIAQRLLTTLDWLVVRGGDGQYDLLIVNALDLIQGALLLHPPSKALFSRSVHMNLLLDLLEPVNCPAIQSAAVATLVVALVDMPQNTRVFEQLDGLLTVTSLFKSRETGRDVKFRLTEFLYFYLTPETPSIPRAESRVNPAAPGLLQRSPSKLAKVFGGVGGAARSSAAGGNNAGKGHERPGSSENGATLSVEAKKFLVDRYLPGVVDELLKDLDTYKPFGGVLS
ncbi:0314f888-dbfa-4637-a7ae-c9ed010bd51a [Thermothielavioides terrestris]|uniref:0314f888-dbfa-4637-a7ae-c9ed010bd51a n=1 Tax=Thermothielavioides terrestris TaxID=2587410 RepID=A0A446BI94_9PEZI|nr:0314f888-dbfa-4637-a7ae-c9ed010bd51a [Thermothielavioides terrestris]